MILGWHEIEPRIWVWMPCLPHTRVHKIWRYYITIYFYYGTEKDDLFYLFPVVSRLCVLIWMRFCMYFSLLTIVYLRWQVVSDSIIFDLDLLSSFRLVFSFLSFKISAYRNFNLLWSLLLPDFSHSSFFACKLLIISSAYFYKLFRCSIAMSVSIFVINYFDSSSSNFTCFFSTSFKTLLQFRSKSAETGRNATLFFNVSHAVLSSKLRS